jgi:hypothetical protein
MFASFSSGRDRETGTTRATNVNPKTIYVDSKPVKSHESTVLTCMDIPSVFGEPQVAKSLQDRRPDDLNFGTMSSTSTPYLPVVASLQRIHASYVEGTPTIGLMMGYPL